MRPLILTAFVCFCTFCYSQNAYYDMLELVRWSRLDDTSAEKRLNAEAMLVKLLKYSEGTGRPYKNTRHLNIHNIYLEADSLYSFSQRYTISKDYIIKVITELRSVPPTITVAADKRDVDSIRMLVPTRYRDSVKYEQMLKVKKAYEQEIATIQARKADTLSGVIRRAFNEITSDTLSNYNLNKTQFDSDLHIVILSKLSRIPQDNFDSVLNAILEPIQSYIKLIYDHSNALYERYKDVNEEIYNRTMRLSPDAFRYIFQRLNLKPEKINRSEDNKDYLFAKSTMEEMKYQDLAEASNPQRLADLNFPTQTEIIDAIALYLVKRAKQEAALLFIERLSAAIKSDELAQDLFPSTWKVMQMEEAYIQPRFGTQWRNAIATDYISLPENIMSSKYLNDRLPDGELKKCFADAVTFGTYVARKYNFIDIMRTLHSDHSKLQGKWTKIGVDVMYIINEELYDSTQQRYWISPEAFFELDTTELYTLYDLIRVKYSNKVCPELKTLFDDISTVRNQLIPKHRFYTELLTILQQFYVAQTLPVKLADGSVSIRDGFWDTQRTFLDFVCDNEKMLKLAPKEVQALKLCQSAFYVYDYVSNKNYIAAADHIVGIIGTLLQNSRKGLVNINSKEINSLGASAAGFSELVKQANRSFDELLLIRIIRDSLKTTTFLQLDQAYFTGRFDGIAEVIRSLYPNNEATVAINELRERLKKLDTVFATRVVDKYSLLKNVYDTLSKSDKNKLSWDQNRLYRNRKELTIALLNHAHQAALKQNSVYFKWLADFSGLLTEIVNARDRSTLANVIESRAMPTGSYRAKRNSNFSIDINAYVGGYGAFEKIKGDSSFHPVYGLTAPIGISFTWGTRRSKQENDDDLQKTYITKRGRLKYRTQSSFTLDISLIDIGAAVSYRLTNSDESKGLPSEVKWDQVLAYGINARWGIKRTPLCFGIGVQKTPQLRSFKGDLADAWRFHATFTFDLPLFNIYRTFD